MYCPRCGTKLPDIAKFCAKCGRPLPRHAEPTRDASSEIPPQVKSPLAISGTAESAQPSVEPPPPTLTQPMEVVPTPVEEPRVLVLKVPLDLPGLSGRADLYLIGAGVLTVLVAFFLSWFHVSSPIANVFLGGLATLDFSGLVILGIPRPRHPRQSSGCDNSTAGTGDTHDFRSQSLQTRRHWSGYQNGTDRAGCVRYRTHDCSALVESDHH